MAHNCHLRFTPAGQDYDLSGLLLTATKYIVSREQATKEHYHICFETDQCQETIRAKVLSTLKIPKTGRGQGNTHYCLKWDKYKNWTPEYACKSGDIISSLGYSQDEIEDAIFRGSIKYNKQKDVGSKGANIDVSNPICDATVSATTPHTEWERLLNSYRQIDRATERSAVNIKRWIKSYYLQREKPIPREGDLKRYAYSLYAIIQNKTTEEDQVVLEETQEIYL